MYEHISDFNLFSSIMIGMTTGMLLGSRWDFPKNIWGFFICFALNIYSIEINEGLFLLSGEVTFNQAGIIISPILFSFFFVLNVLFIFRKLNENLIFLKR